MLEKRIDLSVEYAQAEQTCPNGQCSLVKTATDIPEIFDGVKLKKNHAYLYVIAMGAGEYYNENKNGDFFKEKDLIDYHKKFLTSGIFVQHDNKDPNKSIGTVLKSNYNNKMHRVELLLEIKKALAPNIYEDIKNNNRIAVSMGVKTPSEYCSFCGHVTKDTLANRCEHLKFKMHQIMPNGVKVYAVNNPPLNFFDISIVRKPADHQGYAMFQKVASYEENTDKIASTDAIDKVAELIKRVEALDSYNPLSVSDINEMRSMPQAVLGNVLRKHDVLLRPSEYAGLMTPRRMLTENLLNRFRGADNGFGLLKILRMLRLNKPAVQREIRIIKIASSIEEEPLIQKIIGRNFLSKEAAQAIPDRDVFGNKVLRKTITHRIKGHLMSSPYAQINYIFKNGDSMSLPVNHSTRDFEEYIHAGAVDSVVGIMPNGVEQVVWSEKW